MGPKSRGSTRIRLMAGRGEASRGRAILPDVLGLELEDVEKPATSATLFGNEAPLELEVGSGKGTFLVSESKRRPEINFVGVEYARLYWRFAEDRRRRNACENVRVVLAHAVTFIRDYLEDESLHAAHVYFPDPWPKTRHGKRRFVQPDRIELLARKLKPGARLQVVTDHAVYFEQIQEVVRGSSLTIVDFDMPASALEQEIVGSNFERKYRREGRRLHAIAARRV